MGVSGPTPGRVKVEDHAAISCRELNRSFARTRAVVDLSLEVPQGEIFALLGPDGAGKTTTMRLLAGLLRPDSGTALVDGHDVVRRPEEVRKSVGYMPQNFGLYSDLTVEENIEFYADIYRVPRQRRAAKVKQLLSATDLAPFVNRRAGALSGGMKQKLTLCCALIHVPRILLLDEPTLGVDPVSRREFWKLLYALLGEGVTIMVATSYMDEAQRAGRVGLLETGRLLYCDPPGEIGKVVDQTLFEITCDDPTGARSRLQALDASATVTLYGITVHVLCDPARLTPEMIKDNLSTAGIALQSMAAISPTLEDAFIYLVKKSREGRGQTAAPKKVVSR